MRAREMSIMDGAATVGIALRVEAEKNMRGLAPIGPVALRIEQPHIELHMISIIRCKRLTGRRFVQKRLCCLSHHTLVIARNAFVNHLAGEIAIFFDKSASSRRP